MQLALAAAMTIWLFIAGAFYVGWQMGRQRGQHVARERLEQRIDLERATHYRTRKHLDECLIQLSKGTAVGPKLPQNK